MKDEKGFFSILGLIVSLIIVMVVCYLVFKSYLVPMRLHKNLDEKMFKEQDIDTSSYQAIKESTKKKVEEINKQYEIQLNGLSNQTGN